MAEAHQAVAFQFSVSDEGISVKVDRSAVKYALQLFFSGYRTRFSKVRNAFWRGIFPASPISLLCILAALHLPRMLWGRDTTFGALGLAEDVLSYLGLAARGSFLTFLVLSTIFSFVSWILLSYMQRYFLKFLLTYKGWMYDPRNKQSLMTKVWAVVLRLIEGPFRPMLLSYQQSLPRLPVPPLKDTCQRYLDSVKALLSDEEFEEMKKLVKEFQNGPGKKMQRYLYLKSWWSTNYVTDWWEEYVYLSGRSSILINSNYYACDTVGCKMVPTQSARAAMVIHVAFKFKEMIQGERMKPLLIRNMIPLCSFQYERLFGTYRIPGQEKDKLVQVSPDRSRHVVVHSRGKWYKISMYLRNRLLQPVELEWQISEILKEHSKAEAETDAPGEKHLAALTADKRKDWAVAREMYFSKGTNKKSLETIQTAAFVVFLDDSEPVLTCKDDEDCDSLSDYCKRLLCGSGSSHWLDKSFSITIYANGRFGVNAEHSWADAPIIGHFLEYCSELERSIGYTNSRCRGGLDALPPKPTRLEWDIPSELENHILRSLKSAEERIADIDLCVIQHGVFGKGDIKKCKMSPDAFIQMALQLAYYKDAGKFCLTYEASMTRLYREGRTETVRPVTVESAAFVRAMCDQDCTNEERKKLLQVAVDKHTDAYKDAMTGKGIDRHLFCLYVLSRYFNIKSHFLDKVLGEPWRLSTSQTPTQQTGRIDYNDPDNLSPGGGFGPVTQDGYGVSYIIPGDECIYFHVSSFKSSPCTDSRRLVKHIKESMGEMRGLFLQ